MERTRNITKHFRIPDAINCSPESNFTMIPNTLIKDPTLTCKAKIILFILLSNKHGWQSHVTSVLTMVKEGISTVQTGVRELEREGYLKRVQYRNKKTKAKAGSFWAYSNIPYNLEIANNVRLLSLSGYELYPEKARCRKARCSKATCSKTASNNTNNTNNTNNKKKVNKKVSPFSSFQEYLTNNYLKDETFINSLNDFIEHRSIIKIPLTELAIKKLSNKFLKFTPAEVIEALDASVESGKWPGVYPKSKNGFNKIGKNSYAEPDKTYRESDITV